MQSLNKILDKKCAGNKVKESVNLEEKHEDHYKENKLEVVKNLCT